MKKLLVCLLVLVLVLNLAACGGKNDNDPNAGDSGAPVEENSQPEENAGEAEPPAVGEEPELPDTPEEDVQETEPNDDAEGETAEEDSGASVTASHTDVTLKAAGDSFRLTPKGITGVYAAEYASADPAVATVAEDGTVTAVAPGTTTISMHVEGNGNQFDFTCIVRCAWKEQASGGDQAEDTGTKQSFADFFAGLQTSYEGLGAMMAYEGELLDNYYAGLSDISTKQMLVQETMMSMANCAVALVEVSDSADVETVKTILQDRAKTQADGGAWYPASCETWEQAVIVAAGNYVGMFVYPDSAQAMADAFTAAYGG